MAIASYDPHYTSIPPPTQNVQSPAAQRATDRNEPTTTAHVTPASDDVFSSARQAKPPYLHGVPGGWSRSHQNDSAAIPDRSDDKSDASRRRRALDGEIKRMDVYPAERDKIMRELDGAIITTRAALDQIDHHWNARTLSKMEALFGHDVKSGEVRSALKSRLENALSGLEEERANKGSDLFIQDPGIPNTLAYSRKDRSGYTGQVVFSKAGLSVVDDARIQKTLIHEAMHVASKLTDHWYVKIDENGDFYRKAPSLSRTGPLPPLTSGIALDNADSVAYAAVVLATNDGSYHDEL